MFSISIPLTSPLDIFSPNRRISISGATQQRQRCLLFSTQSLLGGEGDVSHSLIASGLRLQALFD